MRILAIETSCDETSLAVVEVSGGLRAPRFKVLKNLVASQVKAHRPYGGVVPNIAKREHIKNLPILLKKLAADFSKSKFKNQKSKLQLKSKKALSAPYSLLPTPYSLLSTVDLIAVTVGPGLEPALWQGIEFAKQIQPRTNMERARINAEKIQRSSAPSRHNSAKPAGLIGVNHLEGHLYSFLLPRKAPPRGKPQNHSQILKNLRMKNMFPAIALIASGGHTILIKMESLIKWKKLGETLDDAAGEAYDKVARMLGLPYPGGPEIEKLAKRGKRGAIAFPRPMLHDKSYNFSFSGLKTAVLYYMRDAKLRIRANAAKRHSEHSNEFVASNRFRTDVAASFQQAVIDVLVHKTMRAAEEFGAKSVMLSGGVAANKLLRKTLAREAEKSGARLLVPDIRFNLDNAAMIAAAGYITLLRGKKYPLAARGDLGIS